MWPGPSGPSGPSGPPGVPTGGRPAGRDTPVRETGRRGLLGVVPFAGIVLLALLVGVGVPAVVSPVGTAAVVRTVLGQWTPVALLAIGFALTLAARSPDLSLGGGYAVAAAVFAGLGGGVVGLLAAVLLGAVIGAVNGALAGLLRLHPALTTLATGSLLAGIAVATSPQGIRVAGPLPGPLLVVLLVLALLAAVAVDAVSLGRGSRPGPAVRYAAPVSHVVAGALAALGGVAVASYLQYVNPAANGYVILLAVAAAVLGGTSATGRWRCLTGAVLAAGLLTAVSSLLALASISTWWTQVLAGVLAVLALGGDRLRDRIAPPRPGPNPGPLTAPYAPPITPPVPPGHRQ